MDYLAAADLAIQPSIIEASNQVMKEAAIVDVPCMACHGIGDFDEMIEHGYDGLLVSKDNAIEEMCVVIREYYPRKDELKAMGKRMKQKVLDKFNVENVIDKYLALAE